MANAYQDWINSLNPATRSTEPDALRNAADYNRLGTKPVFGPESVDEEWYIQEEIRKARELEDARAKTAAIEQAMKLRGQMNYQRDVEAGIPPQEAFRRNVSDLLFSSPERMAEAVKAPVSAPEFISGTPIRADGKTLGYAVVDPMSGRPQSTTWTSDRPSYDQQQAHRVAMQAWRNARQDLNTLQRIDPINQSFIPDYRSRLEAATSAVQQAEEAVKGRAPNLGQPTNAAPPAPAKSGPATPKTKAEVEALPKGAPFVNPADGKIYYKK